MRFEDTWQVLRDYIHKVLIYASSSIKRNFLIAQNDVIASTQSSLGVTKPTPI